MFAVPAGSCDAHAHVVDPGAGYPLVDERRYTPPPASEGDYLRMLDLTGMSRGVLVQISVYGTDNRHLLHVLERHPGRLRGVAVVDTDVPEDLLTTMHAAGVRGARLNVLFGGGVGLEESERLADRVAEYGWHLEILLDVRDLPDLAPRLKRLRVPLVIDHMGHTDATRGPDQPGFRALLDLLDTDRTWVKLSGAYRIDPRGPDYPHAATLAHALVQRAPHRLLYGSDWPHVAVPYAMPDTGHLRNLLARWLDDERQLSQVLVDNPASLYGFDQVPAGRAPRPTASGR